MIAVQILRNYWLQITRLLEQRFLKLPTTHKNLDVQKIKSFEIVILWGKNSKNLSKQNFLFADVWVLETT